MNQESRPTTYAVVFQGSLDKGSSIEEAFISVAEVYLDGRPARRSKQKINQAERDETFWLSKFWSEPKPSVKEMPR